MDDTPPDTPTPPAQHLIPAFTPVPRLKERSNGWKPEVQRAFIEALADTGSVTHACKRVGRSTHGAYALRRSPGAEQFAAAWQAAVDHGITRLEDIAMDRALNGVEETLYSYGKEVGKRRRYNDRLLMFMLRNRAPDRYAVGVNGGKAGGSLKGLNAVGKMEKRRLKRKWRKKWEAEQEARRAAEKAAEPSPGEVRASIARKVETLRQQVLADRTRKADDWRRLSPEAREAYRTWMALRRRDLGGDEGDDFGLPAWAVSEEELARTAEREDTAPKLIEDGRGTERVGAPPSNDWRDFEDSADVEG